MGSAFDVEHKRRQHLLLAQAAKCRERSHRAADLRLAAGKLRKSNIFDNFLNRMLLGYDRDNEQLLADYGVLGNWLIDNGFGENGARVKHRKFSKGHPECPPGERVVLEIVEHFRNEIRLESGANFRLDPVI